MAERSRPNVAIIVSHDIGRRFGAYGNREVVSPNVDRLSESAYRFDAHYCQWPLCGPSRANLFTGCYPPTTQRYDNQPFFSPFRERTGYTPATIPEALRRAGYSTAAFGFVFHDDVDAPSWSEGHVQVPEWADHDERFSEIPVQLLRGWRSDAAKEIVRRRWHALAASGVPEDALADPATERAARGPAVERCNGPDNSYPDGAATDAALEWLGSSGRSDAPFCIAVGFVAGHTPFRAPARDWDIYDRDSLTLPAFRDAPEGSPVWAEGDSEPAQFYTTDGYTKPWRADAHQSRELLHGHYATITYIDRQIGRIVDALPPDTIVVVVSDHGFHDGHHGYWGKHNVWEQSLQTPLIVSIPGRGGGAIGALTEHVDLFPTLCDLTAIETPPHVEGTSFAHLFDDPDAAHKDAVFAFRRHMWHDRLQVYTEARSVRTSRYRYTRYLGDDKTPLGEELFDYLEDPDERVNRIGTTAPATIAELRRRLDQGPASAIR